VPAPFEGTWRCRWWCWRHRLIVAISLFSHGVTRLWAPLLGVLGGSAVAGAFGMIDVKPIAAAPWIGLPAGAWPGLALDFPPAFWMLLPAFVLITLVGGIETYADSISVQRTSRRVARPIDFRGVQGAINADGVGSFIAGILGTVPNTVYSSSVAVVELTGVASRRVGWWGGAFLILLAFCPKISAVVAAMPGPVAGAFIMMIIVLLFGHGIRLVNEDGLGFEVGLAVCLGFWVGFGFQQGTLFNEMLPSWAQLFLSNGTTAGGLTAILLMLVISVGRRSRDRLTVPLALSSIGQVRTLIQGFADRLDKTAEDRLCWPRRRAALLEQWVGDVRRAASGPPPAHGMAELEYVGPLATPDASPPPASDPGQDLSRAPQPGRKAPPVPRSDYLLVRVDSTG
jgi:NCS2 family nucleobase:cation symporter-2/xanthine permease XanP